VVVREGERSEGTARGGRGVNFNDLGKIVAAVSDRGTSTTPWNARGRNAAGGALGRHCCLRARATRSRPSDWVSAPGRGGGWTSARGRGALSCAWLGRDGRAGSAGGWANRAGSGAGKATVRGG
jgi:hypothetical protein